MHARSIHPALRGLVYRYGAFEDDGRAAMVHREMPFPGVPLILTFAAPYLLSEATNPDLPIVPRRSFIAGLHATRTASQTTGATWAVQVDLTPIGALRILGFPLGELANLVVPTNDLLGAGIDELEQRLYHANSWDERFDLMDRFLLRRLANNVREPSALTWAWHQLRASHGGAAIAELAAELQWSRKRLIGMFENQLGVSPKLLARMLRFQRLLTLDARSANASWAQLAREAGYFDQAHLIREFRDFAGITPGHYRQLERMGGVIDADIGDSA